MGSKALSLNWTDIKKIVKGTLIAAGGAALTYLTVNVIPDLESANGIQMILFASFSSIINAGRKWLTDQSK